MPQATPTLAHVFGVHPPPPMLDLTLCMSTSTGSVTPACCAYMSQLIDQVIVPRKFGWFAFMCSVWQLVFAVTHLYALLIVVVLMNGAFDDLDPEGTPNAT